LDFSFKDDVTVVLLLGVSFKTNGPYVFIGQRRVYGDWRATMIWKGDLEISKVHGKLPEYTYNKCASRAICRIVS
jgi:hypothetical protein